MIQQVINTSNSSILQKNQITVRMGEQMNNTGRKGETGMKIGAEITNIFVSLLVVALLTFCFRL
jgi:hypothetical protein